MVEEVEDAYFDNGLLEDIFVKNQFSKSLIDPFAKDVENSKESTNTTANSKNNDPNLKSKYARLPNGMIINNDVEELKR